MRTAYVNGAFLPLGARAITVEDRGFQLGDAIYEVWAVRRGRLVDAPGHFARLTRSLAEIGMAPVMSDAALQAVLKETLRRNRVQDGLVYLQISRGAAPRDHGFPPPTVKPTIVVTAKALESRALDAQAEIGVRVITLPDERWARCDIKSVGLLPNVLAKQKARTSGAFEAWLVDSDGRVTEGASTTAWIVDGEGRLRTRALSHQILPGVTRGTIMEIAHERQLRVVEEPFTPAEARAAREAFLTSAINGAMPIISIDDKIIGDGKPGPIAAALRAAYYAAL